MNLSIPTEPPQWLTDGPLLLLVVTLGILIVWGLAKFSAGAVRFIRATPFQRKRMRHAWRIARQWKKLAPNVGLARIDKNSQGRQDWQGKTMKPITVVPKIIVSPEPWGIRVLAKTIPKVGIEEYEKAAGWLADAWGCQIVEVGRIKAGLVELRGLVGDPLDDHFPYEFPEADDWSLPIGRNPWGRQIKISLRELSGIKIAGIAGYGKTMLMLGWLTSLAGSMKVQFALFDGKTSDPKYGDWGDVGGRAMFIVGDDPEIANQRLTELVWLIKDRPARLVEERGTHKFWKHGPTEINPLVLVVMDECHNYIDSSGLRGKDKEVIESNQRMMRTVSKEGRGNGVIPVVATQKQTGDAIPTAVRDNLEVGICFASFTIDAAEAALGSGIRDDKPNWPMQLLDKERYAGVCIVTGVPGLGGQYDRVRVGDLDDTSLTQHVQSTVQLRHNVIPAAPVEDVPAESPIPFQKPRRNRRNPA